MRHVSDFDMATIRRLVGPATREDLRAVECYVEAGFGVFIPSVGQCGYAITRAHTHPAWSFILYFHPEDAHMTPTIEIPESHRLGIAIEPDLPHEEAVSDGFLRYAAVLVDPEAFSRIWAQYSPNPVPRAEWLQFAVHADVFFYLKRFMNECDEARSIRGESSPLARALTEPIVHLIARDIAGNGRREPEKPVPSATDGIARAIEHVERHFAEPLTAATLASIAGLSVSAFSRRFREETGRAPGEYVTEVRIRKAKLMLDDPSLSVTAIAQACGFYDASHFSSSFQKYAGTSPTRYAARFSASDPQR
jgi:AraC-like DNA-binding protein